ncbi:hypothetical protein LMG26685_04115 [Achromobacter mucicolens]|nr:hypothetical protein LMG26685_04115 [Achromobacter mucicolens]
MGRRGDRWDNALAKPVNSFTWPNSSIDERPGKCRESIEFSIPQCVGSPHRPVTLNRDDLVLLRRSLFRRIALGLFARGLFFLLLRLLLLLLVRLILLGGWRRRASGAEASGECHDRYLLGRCGRCHVLKVRLVSSHTYTSLETSGVRRTSLHWLETSTLEATMSQRKDVSATERWDNEGGAQIYALLKNLPLDELEDREKRILAFLGASVLSLWEDLPKDARQRVLNAEMARASFDKTVLRERIAQLTGQPPPWVDHHEP